MNKVNIFGLPTHPCLVPIEQSKKVVNKLSSILTHDFSLPYNDFHTFRKFPPIPLRSSASHNLSCFILSNAFLKSMNNV